MTNTTTAGAATAPAAGRRVTPTGRLILPADADRAKWLQARRSGIGTVRMSPRARSTARLQATHVRT